jgi:hypothetical protein
MLFHLGFLIASVTTFFTTDIVVYYEMELTHDQSIPVKPIFVSLIMHTAAIFFHMMFAITAENVIQNYFMFNNSNAVRWMYQFFTDGAGIVGLMEIHGFGHIETLAVTLVVFASTLILCYYQDQYLNTNFEFLPELEPHIFAIPIYVMMICFIIAKSAQSISDSFSNRIALITIISLFQTCVTFVIQRLHIYLTLRDRRAMEKLKEADRDQEKQDRDDDEDGERDALSVENFTEGYLDMDISILRRGIIFEVMQYANSTLFQMTISWLIISITRSKSVLPS